MDGPKIAAVGTCKAAAMCMGALSLQMKRLACSSSTAICRRLVLPAKFTGLRRILPLICAAKS